MLSTEAKKVIGIFLITSLIFSESVPFKQIVSYFYMSHQFKFIGRPSFSHHTMAYNVDSKTAEDTYNEVRHILNVDYINDRVCIVRVKTQSDGSIGVIEKQEVLGVYLNNVIVYDGDPITLKHELAHFFYEKMRDSDRSEMFAQITEKFFYLYEIIK